MANEFYKIIQGEVYKINQLSHSLTLCNVEEQRKQLANIIKNCQQAKLRALAQFLASLKMSRQQNGFETSQKNWQIYKIMELLNTPESKDFQQAALDYIINHFEEFQFFVIYSISQKFKLEKLNHLCLQQLIKYQFEQLNFHRYNLMECEKQVFEVLINIHEKLKSRQIIKGLSESNMNQIIKQFCQLHSTQIKVDIEHKKMKQKISLDKQVDLQQFIGGIKYDQQKSNIKNKYHKRYSSVLDNIEKVNSIQHMESGGSQEEENKKYELQLWNINCKNCESIEDNVVQNLYQILNTHDSFQRIKRDRNLQRYKSAMV